MIIGAHSITYSKNPEADRVFLRDVLELPMSTLEMGGSFWIAIGGSSRASVRKERCARVLSDVGYQLGL